MAAVRAILAAVGAVAIGMFVAYVPMVFCMVGGE